MLTASSLPKEKHRSVLADILKRIESAFGTSAQAIQNIDPALMDVRRKTSGDLVTQVDIKVNQALQEVLRQPGDGWLSEEGPDDPMRLKRDFVWVVDPLDGTSEFVAGNPEWAVSVGYIEYGQPVAGGIWNPAKREMFLGAAGLGTTLNGLKVSMSDKTEMESVHVLASRTEVAAGDWKQFGNMFLVEPVGSVAYKLARVAAGTADATWTMGPRNEWDVAAGAALILASGGDVLVEGGRTLRFNQLSPLMPRILAANRTLLKKFSLTMPWRR